MIDAHPWHGHLGLSHYTFPSTLKPSRLFLIHCSPEHLRLNSHKTPIGREWAGLFSSYISYHIFINWDWVYMYIMPWELDCCEFTLQKRLHCVGVKGSKPWTCTSEQRIPSLGDFQRPTGHPKVVLCWEWLFLLKLLQWHHNIESCAVFRLLSYNTIYVVVSL